MRVLKKLKQGNLLFFDIETASVVPQLEIDTPLFDSWSYKVRKKEELTDDEVIESYAEKAGLYPEFAKVVSIVVGKIIDNKIKLIVIDNDSEKDLLETFNKVVERNIKCELVGFYSSGFDTPFVYKRMIINGVEPHSKLDCSGLKPWELEGIDLAMEWKGSSFERAGLLNIATALGLPSPKDDISGADVGKVYWSEGREGLNRISEYCKKDVATTINVFKKMRLEEPLEVDDVEDVPVEELPLITKLFNGGKYGAAEKKELKQVLDNLSDDDRDKAFIVLDSMVSGAKGKVTKIKKSHVKALKDGK